MTADPNALFRAAEQAYVAGDDARALARLAEVARIAGEQPPVLHLAALAHKRRGEHAAARRAFEAALRLAPRDPQINSNHANLLDAMGEHEAALAAYARAIEAAPGFTDARLNRALLLQRLGRPEEALPDLDHAARAGRPGARLLTARGGVLRDLERLDEAAAAFDAALAAEPARPAALAGRARVALERGEPDAATRHARALEVRPEDEDLRLGHALALEAEGDASAIPLLEDALARRPGWVEGHEQLARMRWENGDRNDFARSFRDALAAAPDDRALNLGYWRTLLQAERYRDALDAMDVARGRLGDAPDLLLAEALAASEAGERARADRLFERLGEAPEAATSHARHLLRSGEPDRAATLLERVTAERPGDIAAWAYLSLAWRSTGDDRAAWLCDQPGLHAAIDLDIDPERLAELAMLLRDLHRTRAHPIGQSLRGGTQTRGRLFARTEPALARLRTAFDDAIARHMASLPPRDAAHPLLRHRQDRFALAGSWSVRLRASGHHVNHIHPEGVISSAFYVALPPDLGRTDAREGWLDLGAPPAELGLDLPPLATVEPRPGRLALFPSYLFHGTRPFANGERLTVAFDVRA